MQPARLLLGFLFMTAWLAGLARFKAFFHSSTLAVVLMAYVFLFVTERRGRRFRHFRQNDEPMRLNLNSNVNHG